MGRGSFWDRMEKIGAEKNAARKEKEEERAKKKAAPRTRSSSSRAKAEPVATGRVKVVWSVRNHMGDEVANFPYPQKEAAEAEAARLTEEKDKNHYVQSHKVPIDD